MCCVISAIVFIGPRAGLFVWWLFNPTRFGMVFDNIFLPILGGIFVPITTLTYMVLYRPGVNPLTGVDWLWIAIALLIDFSLYGGGVFSRRRK